MAKINFAQSIVRLGMSEDIALQYSWPQHEVIAIHLQEAHEEFPGFGFLHDHSKWQHLSAGVPQLLVCQPHHISSP